MYSRNFSAMYVTNNGLCRILPKIHDWNKWEGGSEKARAGIYLIWILCHDRKLFVTE